MSGTENKNLLISNGINVKGYNIIASRALDLKVSFKVKNNLNNDEVMFEVNSNEEQRILKESLSSMMQVFSCILT